MKPETFLLLHGLLRDERLDTNIEHVEAIPHEIRSLLCKMRRCTPQQARARLELALEAAHGEALCVRREDYLFCLFWRELAVCYSHLRSQVPCLAPFVRRESEQVCARLLESRTSLALPLGSLQIFGELHARAARGEPVTAPLLTLRRSLGGSAKLEPFAEPFKDVLEIFCAMKPAEEP